MMLVAQVWGGCGMAAVLMMAMMVEAEGTVGMLEMVVAALMVVEQRWKLWSWHE